MAKILKFDSTRKKPHSVSTGSTRECEHRQVIAYTVLRTVRCGICGTELNPFDVLVDMFKAYMPENDDGEEKRLQAEEEKRGSKNPE